MTRNTRALWILAAALSLGAACQVQGKRQAYRSIGTGADAVREAFNQDAGKVRLVVLVAPT